MQRPPVDNRLELMERALELFAAYGYDGVGVQQICQAANVTKPTLYHYFGNKRGLLEALMRDRCGVLLSALRDMRATETGMVEMLQRAASLVIGFARENPSFYRLYLALWFAPAQSEGCVVASKFHALHFAALEDICGAAFAERPELQPRARALTASLLGMLNNAIGLALNNYSSLNVRVAHGVVDQFLFGVCPRPAVAAKPEPGR